MLKSTEARDGSEVTKLERLTGLHPLAVCLPYLAWRKKEAEVLNHQCLTQPPGELLKHILLALPSEFL